MPEERKPLTPAPGDASARPQDCTHPPYLGVHIRIPGRSASGRPTMLERLACLACRQVKETSAPWREGSLEELDAIHRLYVETPIAPKDLARGGRVEPWPHSTGGPALESTMNRYAVSSKGRGLTAIVAVPGWMDRQQALNLVAWVSVIAELKDEEILAARRQVEDA